MASEPFVWVLKADALADAFELLASADDGRPVHLPRISDVAYMVAGYAVEGLLKALLLARATDGDSRGRVAPATHDLLHLCELSGVGLDDRERHLLERLQEFTTWAGRYPTPTGPEAMLPRTTESGGFAPLTSRWKGADWQPIRDFVRRLKAELPTIRYGLPSGGG